MTIDSQGPYRTPGNVVPEKLGLKEAAKVAGAMRGFLEEKRKIVENISRDEYEEAFRAIQRLQELTENESVAGEMLLSFIRLVLGLLVDTINTAQVIKNPRLFQSPDKLLAQPVDLLTTARSELKRLQLNGRRVRKEESKKLLLSESKKPKLLE
ncbi:MAG: hypothetical protein A2921_02455 [Candidatus Magasanikbacteria bacterium RIFCSPLOWO2_01_FULL_43_20b]|uniref:Uncharacterized protein n=1 Tax=Candidatus Magasanikbacteria bacterium RIFCSPLOWO2_12_FULL_43_12 TaxID=1798692 RepID=A0A1F6MVX1_9BACT|nr:MAG: hypothetical protein A3C74_02500 [Candidatus Magasanikbacteria bacterium RIFCSPHIGHO2_02_FULL_44_13]OGH71533.1 MAG: hypothetical protein A3I93_00675 [Candidatus Magasanikbacteria bacterium RIFCSPLOWO2_02_FULL_43_22]OGH73641.1 MAG: hypothetical protein A2921_02455 [Candidatus Magasanikbacteria bacterium RIFCSPLOWO2_01_FULL_43_20b]OGH75772.1 MAG: hypothetical protein A3G00_04560 [Candidatus Magasanikbacteria bacterium RIFCSPLOWO2_12_FULL_43_12]